MKPSARPQTKFCFVALLLCLVFLASGCCCCFRKPVFIDKLEVAVVMSWNKPKKCVCDQLFEGHLVLTNEPIKLWVRAVNHVDLHKPIEGKEVRLSVINSSGQVQADNTITLSTNRVVTSTNGFALEAVICRGVVPGVFRIRAIYDDKFAVAQSYSRPLRVVQHYEKSMTGISKEK